MGLLSSRRLPDNLEAQAGAATSFHWRWGIVSLLSPFRSLGNESEAAEAAPPPREDVSPVGVTAS